MSLPVSILVIAYGNPLRRDDGAGLVLAERLAQQWQTMGIAVQKLTAHQLVPELAADVANSSASAVVFVDAASAAAPAAIADIQVRQLDEEPANLTLGHHLNPELIRDMAQSLYGVEIPTWLLVTIPGVDFGHGEGLSDSVGKLLACSTKLAQDLSWPKT